MMIIFKPWRMPVDLKDADKTWTEMFDATEFGFELTKVIKNMNIEDKCRDVRDEYNHQRRNRKSTNPLLEGFVSDGNAADIDSLDTAVLNDSRLDRHRKQDENWDDKYENVAIAVKPNV